MALPIADPPLTDGVVTLRPMVHADLVAVEQADADAEIVRWFGEWDQSPAETLEDWMAAWQDETAAAFCDLRCR